MDQQKTYYPSSLEEKKEAWVLVDAKDQVLGRLATHVATILRGKNEPRFTPSVDTGSHVVVINADKIRVTGDKANQKCYYRHSGYPGGLKRTTYKQLMQKDPTEIVYKAIWGMLPHHRLGRKTIKKLRIYVGEDHPHQGQLSKGE